MRVKSLVTAVGLILGLAASGPSVSAISFGQFDTFQDGSTMNWSKGTNTNLPPTNEADGGPSGTGDRYLQNVSLGGFGTDSKMVMFNQVQWTGNYITAGVDRITAQMANFGTNTLYIRITIRDTSFTAYGSPVATELPPDGLWRQVTFDLTPGGLTSIGGTNTLTQTLANVAEVRIVSAIGAASLQGDPVAGTLGVDNLIARDIANFKFRMTQVGIVSGAPRVTFTTILNRSYRVERKDNLTDANWVPLSNATSVAGTGSDVQIADIEPGAGNLPHRFYRAVLLPP